MLPRTPALAMPEPAAPPALDPALEHR